MPNQDEMFLAVAKDGTVFELAEDRELTIRGFGPTWRGRFRIIRLSDGTLPLEPNRWSLTGAFPVNQYRIYIIPLTSPT